MDRLEYIDRRVLPALAVVGVTLILLVGYLVTRGDDGGFEALDVSDTTTTTEEAGVSLAPAPDTDPPRLRIGEDPGVVDATTSTTPEPTGSSTAPGDATTVTTSSTVTSSSSSSSTTTTVTGAVPSSNSSASSPTATTAGPTTTTRPTTTAAPTTTTTPPTTTRPPTTIGSAEFQGVRDFASFFQGTKRYDAWTSGDIAFYAPAGRIPPEVAARWMDWYVRADDLYRVVSGRSDFDSVYRRGTPDLGSRKVLALVETCGAGCGSKQQAEADPGYIDGMLASPDDYVDHWIFFYEMGRGGSPEPWYGRATWPSNTVILPHLMAGLTYYEIGGGEAGLRRFIPGDLLAELERWEQADIEYVDHFVAANQQSVGDYTSHHLMPGMLWKVRMETDLATVGRITANMAAKPEATSGRQAMCDFRAAVNEATGGRFDAQMIGPWGLPHDC